MTSPPITEVCANEMKDIASRLSLLLDDLDKLTDSDPDLLGTTLLQLTSGDLRYVHEKMRHADINTTKQYMHTILSGNAPEITLSYGEE